VQLGKAAEQSLLWTFGSGRCVEKWRHSKVYMMCAKLQIIMQVSVIRLIGAKL